MGAGKRGGGKTTDRQAWPASPSRVILTGRTPLTPAFVTVLQGGLRLFGHQLTPTNTSVLSPLS